MGDPNRRTRASNSPVLVYQRKRRKVSIAPNWSDDLPEDLIISVAKQQTDSLVDFIFFGAVCKSWRLAALEIKKNCFSNTTRLRLLTHQVPLLMLPIIFMRNSSNLILFMYKKVEFYSLGKGKMRYKLNLPRTCTLPKTKMRMCFSSFGWLMTVSKLAKGYRWNLLHPLNHAKIELPEGRARFADCIVDDIQKFALSSSPSWTVDFIVMFHSSNCLGFCRPGLGENWTRINLWTQTSSERPLIMDLNYYKGQFYFVYLSVCISVFDIDKAEIRVVAPEFPKAQLLGPEVRIREQYLVESAGDLLLVLFTTDMNDLVLTTSYRVFEVPLTNSKSWLESEVKSLGNRSIFLSKSSSSFSIEASDYSRCKPNCIYFMNNKIVFRGGSRDMGVFNMENMGQSIETLTNCLTMKKSEDSIYGFNRVCKLRFCLTTAGSYIYI